MHLVYEITVILYRTFIIRVLYKGTKITLIQLYIFIITKHHFNSNRNGTGKQNILCLGKSFMVHKKSGTRNMVMISVECVKEHGHCFRCGSCFIKKRGICKRKTCEITNQGLKIQ